MLDLILRWILLSAALLLVAKIVPGISISGGFSTALIISVVIGLVNVFIRPLVLILTLPLNILTLGLLTFVINALMLELSAWLVSGFEVEGFLAALLGSILLSLFSIVINRV